MKVGMGLVQGLAVREAKTGRETERAEHELGALQGLVETKICA